MFMHYGPILMLLALAIGLGGVLLLIGHVITRHRPERGKNAPYECGFDAFEDARSPYGVRFYLVAILFIIFDLETAFMFPWAVVFKQLNWLGLSSMGLFLGLLTVGFVYEWRRGALEWE